MRTSTIITVTAALLMTACVDTTGLTGDIHTDPHPSTSRNAVVTIIEYADIQCPACRAAHATLTQPLIDTYGTQISFDYRHFPLTSIHRYAMEAAEGAECAGDQGAFWEFLSLAYENQPDLSSEELRTWAQELKLDTALFDRCITSHVKRKAIQASYDEGRAKGVQGTPTFFVNGQQTTATMENMSAAIDAALRQAAIIR